MRENREEFPLPSEANLGSHWDDRRVITFSFLEFMRLIFTRLPVMRNAHFHTVANDEKYSENCGVRRGCEVKHKENANLHCDTDTESSRSELVDVNCHQVQ